MSNFYLAKVISAVADPDQGAGGHPDPEADQFLKLFEPRRYFQ